MFCDKRAPARPTRHRSPRARHTATRRRALCRRYTFSCSARLGLTRALANKHATLCPLSHTKADRAPQIILCAHAHSAALQSFIGRPGRVLSHRPCHPAVSAGCSRHASLPTHPRPHSAYGHHAPPFRTAVHPTVAPRHACIYAHQSTSALSTSTGLQCAWTSQAPKRMPLCMHTRAYAAMGTCHSGGITGGVTRQLSAAASSVTCGRESRCQPLCSWWRHQGPPRAPRRRRHRAPCA